MWDQIEPGAEFGIFLTPWTDGDQPQSFPAGTSLTVRFPSGAIANVTAIEVSGDEAVIQASRTRWRMEKVGRKQLVAPQLDTADAPTTYWIVRERLPMPPQ